MPIKILGARLRPHYKHGERYGWEIVYDTSHGQRCSWCYLSETIARKDMENVLAGKMKHTST